MNKFSLLESSKSESFPHKAIKQLIYKFVSENNKKVVKSSLEKYFTNRRADVYFKLTTGQEIVVEIQSSYITVKELIKRTKDYVKKGIHVLWILYGKGQCVASPKSLEDKKNVKISPVENFLHKIYGGRVYYVDINFYGNKITITPPFVLHFSPSNKK
ncbi:MAG: competence protein CoiA family protein, partial [Promethearchaeota archaeon]